MRIIINKLGAIGDVIQTAAAVRIYSDLNPEICIDWVVSKQLGSLVRAFGVADQVIEIDEALLFTGNIFTRLRALLRVILQLALRRVRYDRVVTAYSDWRYTLLAVGIRARSRSRFNARVRRPSPIQHRNRVFEYWRLLSESDNEPVNIAQAMASLGESVLQSHQADLDSSLPEKFVVLAPGGAKNHLRSDSLRRWPVENYRDLAQRLLSEGHAVVLVGGEGDVWASESFSDLPIVDFIGKTNLTDLIHLLDRADVVVTHDSGPMHMAAITHTGLVALFGPTPPNACLPFARERTIVLHEGNRIACCPCYDGKNYGNCSKPVCLEAISVERVNTAVTTMLPRRDVS